MSSSPFSNIHPKNKTNCAVIGPEKPLHYFPKKKKTETKQLSFLKIVKRQRPFHVLSFLLYFCVFFLSSPFYLCNKITGYGRKSINVCTPFKQKKNCKNKHSYKLISTNFLFENENKLFVKCKKLYNYATHKTDGDKIILIKKKNILIKFARC